MKKLSILLVLCMLMSVFAGLSVYATGADISTDKPTYTQGEPILVTASGDVNHWVGLYAKGTASNPYVYYYVEGRVNTQYGVKSSEEGDPSYEQWNSNANGKVFESGKEWNLLDFYREVHQNKDLPAGEYSVILWNADTIAKTIDIEIVNRSLTLNQKNFIYGDEILLTANGSDKDYVAIYKVNYDLTVEPQSTLRYYILPMSDIGTANQGVINDVPYYNVENRTFASGHAQNISQIYNETRYFPVGDYIAYLKINGSDNIAANCSVRFSVTYQPTVPVSANFTPSTNMAYRADGEITITASSKENIPQLYIGYWANAEGKLEGYTSAFTTRPAPDTLVHTYSMAKNSLVPTGADRILIYSKNGDTVSSTPYTIMLPEGAGSYDVGKLLKEFQIIGDLHITDDANSTANQQFAKAVEDIIKTSPNSFGVFINGDIADTGAKSQYDSFWNIILDVEAATQKTFPEVYAAIGNSDLYNSESGDEQANIDAIRQFLEKTKNESETVYFDTWVGDLHFIFLGSEDGDANEASAYLSDKQIEWFKTALEKDKQEGKPVFVFLHQGLQNTVAGTSTEQGYSAVRPETEAKLREILKNHSEVVLFSGHSHWTLADTTTLKPADENLPAILNTSSVANNFDDYANAVKKAFNKYEYLDNGSQGYYVYVYENQIVFRGRNFATGEWEGAAQFTLAFDMVDESQEDTTPPENSTPSEDSNPSEEATPPSSSDTQKPAQTEATEPQGTESTPIGKKKGCKSSIAAGSVVVATAIFGIAFMRKKED